MLDELLAKCDHSYNTFRARNIEEERLNPKKAQYITEVHKLFDRNTLIENLNQHYDENTEIFLVSREKSNLSKGKISDIENICDIQSIFIAEQPNKKYRDFYDLQDIVKTLRGENGCPWDKKQTHESMKKCLTEESEEVNQAVDNLDIDNLIEELGDVLLIISMQSRIGEEAGNFDINMVTEEICNKLIRRHPHVFASVKVGSPKEALEMWKKIKNEEKLEKY